MLIDDTQTVRTVPSINNNQDCTIWWKKKIIWQLSWQIIGLQYDSWLFLHRNYHFYWKNYWDCCDTGLGLYQTNILSYIWTTWFAAQLLFLPPKVTKSFTSSFRIWLYNEMRVQLYFMLHKHRTYIQLFMYVRTWTCGLRLFVQPGCHLPISWTQTRSCSFWQIILKRGAQWPAGAELFHSADWTIARSDFASLL